jgi:hypothetical protein
LANGARTITIFAVPYDSGYRDLRMGAGPEHLLSNGMEGVLAATGREIRSEVLQATSPFHAEIATVFELFGILAKRVHEATASGRFPCSLYWRGSGPPKSGSDHPPTHPCSSSRPMARLVLAGTLSISELQRSDS